VGAERVSWPVNSQVGFVGSPVPIGPYGIKNGDQVE